MDAGRQHFIRREGISERERTQVADRFGMVLGLLVATVFFSISAPDKPWAWLLTGLALSVTTVIAMWASGAAQRVVRVGYAVAALGLLVAALVAVSGGEKGAPTSAVGNLVLVLLTMGAIGRRIRVHAEISSMTVVAALCIYVLIGLMFASTYEILGHAGADAFFSGGADETRSNFLYFSYITLATVGYGDLTAADGVGRAFAVTEGLVWQIYLVTAVAALVGNLGRRRTGGLFDRSAEPDDATEDAPDGAGADQDRRSGT